MIGLVIFFVLLGLYILASGVEREFIGAYPKLVSGLTIFGVVGVAFFKSPLDLYTGVFTLASLIFMFVFIMLVTLRDCVVRIFNNK